MTNEELIEEARARFRIGDGDGWSLVDQLADALEAAVTPTDEKWRRTSPGFDSTREAYEWLTPTAHEVTTDEREAPDMDERGWADYADWRASRDPETGAPHWDWIDGYQAARRRTEVPEPGVEHASFYGTPEPHPGPRSECKVCPPESQGEPSPIPFYDQKMRELAEIRAQAEPSDAQVEAASREIDLRGFHIPPMAVRAALRAAWEVR